MLRQTGVDVLGINTDFAAEAPADTTSQRFERTNQRSQQSRFPLAIIADDCRPGAVFDF